MEKFLSHYDEPHGEYTVHMYHPSYVRLVPEKDGSRTVWRVGKILDNGSWGLSRTRYNRKSDALEEAKTVLKFVVEVENKFPKEPPKIPFVQASSNMSRKEALAVLGLPDTATRDEIISTFRRLMGTIHPDRGGSNFLMVQINLAREVLA
tara:strand:- start:600 stop:1049 length:450 start_codon:yes stop_codon:yes gene_type:complete